MAGQRARGNKKENYKLTNGEKDNKKKLILIDGEHPEEIRVGVYKNGRLEAFEYQNRAKRQIKGNLYLARVLRIEPSLQAAFVEYGSGKHGFLPFAEIHPYYYQIPVKDREALLSDVKNTEEEEINSSGDEDGSEDNIGGAEGFERDEETEEVKPKRPNFYSHYKIQEVIKRNQVILVQATKEERGNKGASMTTYVSLAGRYCVLMPNSAKQSSGISKKVAHPDDRKRLRDIIEYLSLPDGMNVIIRTAGAHRTKTEIKRDCDYLLRLWQKIREHTVASNAPAFIHAEGDLRKKAIRDIYDSEVGEIIVAGKESYEVAKDFMSIILPNYVRKIKLHTGDISLFAKYQLEEQVAQLFSNIVRLESGAYLVINITEALVTIDVNSGRATREKNIEDTARKTNMEAAKEIARQIMFKELSGLIVIDFIDMRERKDHQEVESVLADALRFDRSRLQIGRISQFGLLEISRQRMKPSLLEANTITCRHCDGRGLVRAVESSALVILRAIESELIKGGFNKLIVSCNQNLVLYVLNSKREYVKRLEDIYKVIIEFQIDPEAGEDGFFIEHQMQEEINEHPLSEVESHPEDLMDEEIPETEEEEAPEQEEAKAKPKGRYRRNNKAFPEKHVKLEQSPLSEPSKDEVVVTAHDKPKRKKKYRSRKKKDLTGVGDTGAPEGPEHDKVDKSSILKEIWKKIVE